jgi:hypothetical protein
LMNGLTGWIVDMEFGGGMQGQDGLSRHFVGVVDDM